MKRSEINRIIRETVDFLNEQKFYLPKFAYWTVEDWKSKGGEIREIIDNQLGWDITDYGSGDFSKIGLIHFTIRNGNMKDLAKGGKNYCEKVLIMEEGQVVPTHHHYSKTEDIINRGGGILMIQLFNVSENDQKNDEPVSILMDGIRKTFRAGTAVELEPGDSITLTPKHYHKFWVKEGGGKVLIGEVSSVNDDYGDNKFIDEVKRFGEIHEDEELLYLLYDDYEKYLKI
ncbi:MAG: D-lyxose/D-mannose family sugar isomerase [Promethearchaeota archaeon]|nr:MAG: D-lyxose/D-mannose family sugar isomerase [Candidatus Lokiarchaeota archaeon]